MQRGNINGAIQLVTNNMKGGILPLNQDTLYLLHSKHPDGENTSEDAMLQGPESIVDPVIFDIIDENMVLRAAQLTRRGSGPSGVDADMS